MRNLIVCGVVVVAMVSPAFRSALPILLFAYGLGHCAGVLIRVLRRSHAE